MFDVTDYALLWDSVELECGNWQELDLKFAFIEGNPPRDGKRDAFGKAHYLSNWDETILPQTYTPEDGESMWR